MEPLALSLSKYSDCTAESISERGINLWWDGGEAPGRDRVFSFLPADTVVLAVGSEKDDSLVSQLTGVVPEVHAIGDCAGKQSIFAAMRGGVEAGRKI